MQMRSWEIGRALGIPIRIHASWFAVFLLATWTLSTDYLPETLPGLSPGRYWVMGAVAAALLFLSVLLHELGHSYVALYYRIPIEQITLFLFGGVAHMRQEAPSPKAEFLIAIAGPIVSFVISGAAWRLSLWLRRFNRNRRSVGWSCSGSCWEWGISSSECSISFLGFRWTEGESCARACGPGEGLLSRDKTSRRGRSRVWCDLRALGAAANPASGNR